MVAEVLAGINSLKAAFDIAKGLKEIDDATRLNGAIIELQEKILSAQAAHAELAEKIAALKRCVAEFEAWDAEAQRYELRQIGKGALAYVIRPELQGNEPVHAICPSCYQRRHKSLLQASTTSYGWGRAECHACKLELSFDPEDDRSPFASLKKES